MGARGPQKTPSQLKLLRGETRPSRLNFDEPTPALVEPQMPEWFDDRHTLAWDRVCQSLRGMRLLHGCDRDVLVAFVRATIRQEDAGRRLVTGLFVDDVDDSEVPNPAIRIEERAAEAVRRFAREFGLTPSARADLTTPGIASPLHADRLLT